MENEKTLLSVFSDGESTAVKLSTKDERDMLCIALALDDIMSRSPELSAAMLLVRMARQTDKDFDKMIREQSVKVPDFDQLLKDLD